MVLSLFKLSFNNNPLIDFITIGKTFKTHGVKGEIEVELDDIFLDWLLKEKVFFLNIDGNPVPFWISEFRNESRLFIKVEDVQTPEAAKILTHKDILVDKSRVPKSLIKTFKEELSNQSFETFTLQDLNSNISVEILQVMEYPSQLVAEVLYKDQKLIIPLHKDFVESVDEEKKHIIARLPEGIFDL